MVKAKKSLRSLGHNSKPRRSSITTFHVGILLLSVALIVGLITVVNIIKFSGSNFLTGAATTGLGQTNLSILTTTSIFFPVTQITFGMGYVGSGTECVMDSHAQMNQTGANCYSFNNVSNGFYIENDGNQNLSINYSCAGNCSAALFIGGTSPKLQIRVKNAFTRNQSGQTNDTAASCLAYNLGGTAVVFGGWNISYNSTIAPHNNISNTEGVYIDLNSSVANASICGNNSHFPLGPSGGSDAGVVDINVSIPDDAPATNINSSFTLTFNAKSS